MRSRGRLESGAQTEGLAQGVACSDWPVKIGIHDGDGSKELFLVSVLA